MEPQYMLNTVVRLLHDLQATCKVTCNTYKTRGYCTGCNVQTLIEELPKYNLVKNPSTELEL